MTAEAYLMAQALREPPKVYESVLYLRRKGIGIRRAGHGFHETPIGIVDNAGLIELARNIELGVA